MRYFLLSDLGSIVDKGFSKTVQPFTISGWDEPLAEVNDKGNPTFSTRPYDGNGWVFFFFQLGFVNTVLAIVSGSCTGKSE